MFKIKFRVLHKVSIGRYILQKKLWYRPFRFKCDSYKYPNKEQADTELETELRRIELKRQKDVVVSQGEI